jgi:hypothetical protein
MGLGFRVFRIIFMRLKPLVSKRAWNMFSLKMLGWDLFEEQCSQSMIPQIHLNICSCSSLRRGGNVAAFMIICHIFIPRKNFFFHPKSKSLPCSFSAIFRALAASLAP